MLLGALLDAGLDKTKWLEEVAKIALPKDSYHLEIKQVQRRTLAAKKFDVIVSENAPAEYSHRLQSQEEAAGSGEKRIESGGGMAFADRDSVTTKEIIEELKDLKDLKEPVREKNGNGDHDEHEGPAVAMSDVQAVIENSQISRTAKDLALRVVSRLGSCEGPVHGMAPDAVYFHEVGAVDTIIDIVGFAIAYEMLGIEKSYVSAVPIGRGHILTAVGYFPVPAPAVALMLAQIKAPILDYEIDFECLTPTAVAILAEICPKWGVMPRFDEVQSVGYGAGTKDSLKHPNVCRVMLGETNEAI
jgi:uncharacterized protein (DUF111 family)